MTQGTSLCTKEDFKQDHTQVANRIALNGSLNKPEGFLNMLQLRKPHNASLFLLLMAKERCKALLLMISRKAVRECGKWCRNYQTDIESEEHCELGKYSGKLQVLQPCSKSKPVRIARDTKKIGGMRIRAHPRRQSLQEGS